MKKILYSLMCCVALVSTVACGGDPVEDIAGDNGGDKTETGKPTDKPKTDANGHDFVDLGLSVKWATCNLGAETPYGDGGYYAWTELEPRTYFQPESMKTWFYVEREKVLDKSLDAARKTWGGTWRMPTKEEFQELLDNCTWTLSGPSKTYYVITGPTGNSIILPLAGYHSAAVLNRGQYGHYWSSTSAGRAQSDSDKFLAYTLWINSNDYYAGYGESKEKRSVSTGAVWTGRSIRPVTY